MRTPMIRCSDWSMAPPVPPTTSQPTGRSEKRIGLLLERGLIRIGLPMPSDGLEFQITDVNDPYGCNTNPTTGLTGSTAGTVSVYRRPLPATNLGFLNTVMWDGREPSLFSQAKDATLGHAQAAVAPTAEQVQQIVTFEGCMQAADPELCAETARRHRIMRSHAGEPAQGCWLISACRNTTTICRSIAKPRSSRATA